MKKFWDKTKETVASGVAKIDSQYDKIIKENPEYEEKIKCLNEFNDVINIDINASETCDIKFPTFITIA